MRRATARTPRRAAFAACCLGVLAATALGAPGGVPPADAVACPNAQFRVGHSAVLPDCRAYELVSPADAQGAAFLGTFPWGTPENGDPEAANVAIGGNSVIFAVFGRVLNAAENPADALGRNDLYRAERTDDGWSVVYLGPTPAQFFGAGASGLSFEGEAPLPDAAAPDHECFAWSPAGPDFLRDPDGVLEPIGLGSLATESQARARWLAPGCDHVIFDTTSSGSRVPIEDCSPPEGTAALYDRTLDRARHCVSLLPGDVVPDPGGNAIFHGVSFDGSVSLFSLGPGGASAGQPLYARADDAETIEVARNVESEFPQGGLLTCDVGPTSDGATTSMQWLRDGVAIPGATESDFTATEADAGAVSQCLGLFSQPNAGVVGVSGPVVVAPASAVPPPGPPVALPSPLPFLASAGTVLTCNPREAEWTGSPTFTYSWYVNGVQVPGADEPTYEVQAADVPSRIQCAVTGTNAGGSVVKVSNNRGTTPGTGPPAPPPTATINVTGTQVIPAGASDDGGKVFYLQAGFINSFDVDSEAATRVNEIAGATLVNVPGDGRSLYFVSPNQLDGAKGAPGENNLYRWEETSGQTTFIATVLDSDVRANFGGSGDAGLGLWVETAARREAPGLATSRSTPDGSALAFLSAAQLTAFDNEGTTQVYLYDAPTDTLRCLSCPPAGVAPESDARFQGLSAGLALGPVSSGSSIPNITADGSEVFFETSDPLAARDTNDAQDVYRWKEGEGVALISTGQSFKDSYLYGMSADGRDVVIATSQVLVPGDRNGGAEVLYDARVGGGLASQHEVEAPGCLGDACKEQGAAAPTLDVPASATLAGRGNLAPPRASCSRAARRARSLSRRAKRARGTARRSSSPRRSKRLSRRAARLAGRAGRESRRARRCRRARASRGAPRENRANANADRRGTR